MKDAYEALEALVKMVRTHAPLFTINPTMINAEAVLARGKGRA